MAESRNNTATERAPSFSMLQMQVDDLAAVAQINGMMFEGIVQNGGPQGNWTCNHQTYLLLSFLVGDLCGRTLTLTKDYEAALDAYSAEHNPSLKAA